MPKVIIFVEIVLLLVTVGTARQNSQKLNQLQSQLKSIQAEIDRLEKDLKTADNKIKTETQSLENIDRQISLTANKIGLYKKEVREKQDRIARLEVNIDSLEYDVSRLQAIFKEQVLFAYKYRRGKHLDWLLGSSNFNQALIRYRYFSKVSAAEKNTYQELEQLNRELSEKQSRLRQEVSEVKQLLASAEQETQKMREKRQIKTRLVRDIKQNKTLLARTLDEKRDSYERIQNLIRTLEAEKPRRQLETQNQLKWEKLSGSFPKNKGNLNWPVSGKLLHKFGRFRNPELKTVLNNTGVDIRANRGGSVRCVFPGIVSRITYMSGFGNMVIVDHNDSYYTVYAHLDEIDVSPGDFIEGGNVIGTVGETGSLEGPKLHFEIYGKETPLNPLEWLK